MDDIQTNTIFNKPNTFLSYHIYHFTNIIFNITTHKLSHYHNIILTYIYDVIEVDGITFFHQTHHYHNHHNIYVRMYMLKML